VSIEKNSFLPPNAIPIPSLDAFRQAAETHDAVLLSLDGETWKVLGIGTLPTSGRKVAWVENPEADTTSAFVQALNQSFSGGISRAVARELDLKASPGLPLASRTVIQALDMAQTGQKALAGVDFLTQLQFSATKNGSEFQRVLADVAPTSALSASDREDIDRQLDRRFADAQAHGAGPVSPGNAEQWLKDALSALK